MAQYIQVGNEVVEFPDDMSDEQISAVLKGPASASTAPTTQKPSMTSELGRQLDLTLRAGITGLSAVPNAVADFASGATNLGLQAVGSEKRVPYLSQLQQEALDKTLGRPNPGLESVVQTGAEAVAGMMTPGVRLPMAQQAEGATARQIATRTGAEAVGAATGAMAGEAAAKQTMELTDSPWASLAAGLATGTIAGSAAGKGTFALAGPRQEPVTIQQIRTRASQGYQAMDEAGVTVKSDSIKNKLVPSIKDSLSKENFDPEIVAMHKPIADNLRLLDKILADPNVDFKRLEKIRGSFSSMAQGSDDASRLARVVTSEIDSYVANLSNTDINAAKGKAKDALVTLSKARNDWRNQSRAQVLQDILDSASAVVEGKGGAISDVLRNKMVNLTSNVDKMKMFSTSEQNVIKAATKATDLEGFLNLLAKFNPQRGVTQSSILTTGLAGAAAGSGPTQLAGITATGLTGAGFLADKALAASRRREVSNLISQIASGNLEAPKAGFAVPGLFGATMGVTP